MDRRKRQWGLSILLAVLVLFSAAAASMLVQVSAAATAAQRDRISERMLAQAREALIAYATDRPITATVGPGYLPCPDLDDDGWAESTCGSLAGDKGQQERLGRLPWKTLGLPDLRDGHGERLWYAVSTRYKGLLNCAASAACVDMSPASALGTITVRDSAGRVVHDGTLADIDRGGAVAVVLAPGPPLARAISGKRELQEQRRDCSGGGCDINGRCLGDAPQRVARCDPLNYLDLSPPELSGEDNADFHDRSDAGRAKNGNGFIHGPVVDSSGRLAVNDRLAVVTWADVMPRVMRRVALELGQCLSFYASRPESQGRMPPPSPACTPAATAAYGRVPDTPFNVPAGALGRWWRSASRTPDSLTDLPTQLQACRIAIAPADEGPLRTLSAGSPSDEGRTAGGGGNAWWSSWKAHVLYAPAAGLVATPADTSCADTASCLALVDAEGRTIARNRRAALVVTARAGECGSPQLDCDSTRCTRVVMTVPPARHDAVVTLP